jgi:hypothetical protein
LAVFTAFDVAEKNPTCSSSSTAAPSSSHETMVTG